MAGKSDTHAWHLFATRCFNTVRRVREKAVQIVDEESNVLMWEIKGQMPWKTGRARTGWGKYTPELMVLSNPDSKLSDAVWEVSEKGLSIQQGTNVPYTEGLNWPGTSPQRPALFIDALAAFSKEQLNARLREIDAEIDRGLK